VTPTATVRTLRDGSVRRRAQPRFDAVSVLTLYLVLLMVLPSRLVFQALGADGTPALVVSFFILLLWATARIPERRSSFEFKPVRLVVLIYVLTNVASYAAAMTSALNPDQIRSADRALLVLAGAAGIALCASDGITTRERLETLMSRLVIVVSICAGVGVLQFVGLDLTRHLAIPGLHATSPLGAGSIRSSFRRVAGTARHPLELATVLCMVLPIALHLAFRAREKQEKIVRWGCVALMGLAIPMSISRTAVVGLVVVAVMLIPTWEPARQRAAIAVAVVWTAGMWLVIPGLIGTLRNLFTSYASDPSVTARTQRYAKIGNILAHHVLLGRGLGTLVGPQYLFDNQYIGTTLEVGILGLAATVMVMLVSIGLARGARRRLPDADGRELAQALAASTAVALVVFATFDAYFYPMIRGLLFLVLGCSGALWRMSRQNASSDTTSE
jgi:O-antigen ligase